MKKLSKLISLFLFILSIGYYSLAQNCVIDSPPIDPSGENQMLATYDSKNGNAVSCYGAFRVLVIFAEIDYTGAPSGITDPTNGGNPNWPAHEFPEWVDELFDPNIPAGIPQGMITRYFNEASFGQFNLLGDYLISPTNGGVFSVPYANSDADDLYAAVDAAMGGNFMTHSGFSIADFDNWSKTYRGSPKVTPSIDSPHKFDHVMIIWRNKIGFNGNGRASGSGTPGNLFGFGGDTYQEIGSYNDLFKAYIVGRHEFAHLMYGDNNFHMAGGWGNFNTDPNYWIPIEHGWSSLSLHSASLLCWNAWDRQRMDWKAPGNVFNPACRNVTNSVEVNGDLDANVSTHAGIYTLRDFVTTGDAVRIRLPFTNPTTEFPEFIWIENHNTVTMNGSPFDQFHYQDAPNVCGSLAPYGLYMYLQIDKDVRQSSNPSEIYTGWPDYLRPITADGFYDRSFDFNSLYPTCIGGNSHPFTIGAPNPLTGGGDQDFTTVDAYSPFNQIDHGDFLDNSVENQNGTIVATEFGGGNPRHAFTSTGNKKLGIGTNPSSASMMNLVSYDAPGRQGQKNLRKIYLNGVSIEIINQNANGNIQVQIRFDDVDVNNDTRWCADEIVLSPVATSTRYSLNIKSGNTITLDQGTTATRMINPVLYNGQNIFVGNTLMRCTANTLLNMESGSNLIVDNNSTLRLEADSRIEIASGATLKVRHGGHLEMRGNSIINVANGGRIIIEEGASANNGTLDYFQNAQINLNGANAVLEIQGILDIKDNANFTFGYTTTAHGYVLFNNTTLSPSRNITVGVNCSMTFNGSSSLMKVLEIEQETLYGPDNLASFTINKGKVVLGSGSRLQPPAGVNSIVNLNLAKFTSNTPGVNNGHRGVEFYGQPNVNVSNCTFEYGKYGINAYNTIGGASLSINNSTFWKCDWGVKSQGKGITLNSCNFFNCNVGWEGYLMTLPSRTIVGNVGGTYSSANVTGYKYESGSTAPLFIKDPMILANYTGVDLPTTSFVSAYCGSVSNNNFGFSVGLGASLQMDAGVSINGGQVTAHNIITINANGANNLYLNQGFNDLSTFNPGTNACILGSFINPASIDANQNKWNPGGTFGPMDYDAWWIGTGNPPITINDQQPQASIVACGQANPPCNTPCDNLKDALRYCPLCDIINTDDFYYEKLNVASLEAIDKAKSTDPNNYKDAVDLFYQILMKQYQNPDEKEKYILRLSYYKMAEALGNAFNVGQIYGMENQQSLQTQVQEMIDVQSKFINDAVANGDYYNRFFYSYDKALTYRLADRRDLALSLLEELSGWVENPQEMNTVSKAQCSILIEEQVLANEMVKEDMEQNLQSCQGVSFRLGYHHSNTIPDNSTVNEEKYAVYPNPVQNELTIISNIEHGNVSLINFVGQKILGTELNYDSFIDLAPYPRGIYVLKIENNVTHKKYHETIVLQ